MTNETDIPPLPEDPQDLPLLMAARAMRDCLPGDITLSTRAEDLALTLSAQLLDPDARDLDDRLATQARLLDTLFSAFVTNGVTRKHYDLECLSFALKAQAQCNNAVNSLHRVRDRRRQAERQSRADVKKDANEMKKLLKCP